MLTMRGPDWKTAATPYPSGMLFLRGAQALIADQSPRPKGYDDLFRIYCLNPPNILQSFSA